jgi:hypothetical protein
MAFGTQSAPIDVSCRGILIANSDKAVGDSLLCRVRLYLKEHLLMNVPTGAEWVCILRGARQSHRRVDDALSTEQSLKRWRHASGVAPGAFVVGGRWSGAHYHRVGQ